MAVVRRIETVPLGRLPASRWDTDPGVDSFFAAARPVFELYCSGLETAGLVGRRSVVEVYVARAEGDDLNVEVAKGREQIGDANVYVPTSFSQLEEGQATRTALDVVDGLVRGLGHLYGWPDERLDELRASAETQGLRMCWQSDWKRARGGGHEARGRFWVAPDGLGRVQLEVRDSRTAQVVARTAPTFAFPTLRSFRQSAGTLRWQGQEAVGLVPWVDAGGNERDHLLVDLAAPVVTEPGEPPPVTPAPPGPVSVGIVRAGALVHVSPEQRRHALEVWLDSGGLGFWYTGSTQETDAFDPVLELWDDVLSDVRGAYDGHHWLSGSPYVNVRVQLWAAPEETLLGGTERYDTAVGTEILSSLVVDLRPVLELPEADQRAVLRTRLLAHLDLVGKRRRLGPLPAAGY